MTNFSSPNFIPHLNGKVLRKHKHKQICQIGKKKKWPTYKQNTAKMILNKSRVLVLPMDTFYNTKVRNFLAKKISEKVEAIALKSEAICPLNKAILKKNPIFGKQRYF